MKKLKYCGKNVLFQDKIKVNDPENIYIEDNVYIGPNSLLAGKGGIIIGKNTAIGLNTVILSASHDYNSDALPYAPNVYILKPVLIGKNVWIGANVVIAPGTKIGDGAIIAAGSVVSGSVEPLAIVGNQPTRLLKYRDKNHYERLASKAE
jgi:maltose O-acetyltransferase